MKLKKVRIEGFKSYQVAQVIDLAPQNKGLYCVTGENLVDPELGANGVGKSTILDAVTWCLYGYTTNKQTGPSLENSSDTNPCTVRLAFENRGIKYELLRGRSPTVLSLSANGSAPKAVSQDEVDAKCGFDYNLWMLCVVANNPEGSFFDLTPAPRLQLFSSILGLDIWDDCAEVAKGAVKKASAIRDGLEIDIAKCERGVALLRERLDELRDAQAAQQEKQEAIKKDFAKKISDCKVSLKAAIKNHSTLSSALTASDDDYEGAVSAEFNSKEAAEDIQTKHVWQKATLTSAEKTMSDIHKRNKTLFEVCGYCQKDAETCENEYKQAAVKVKALAKALAAARAQLKNDSEVREKLQGERAELRRKIAAETNTIAAAESKLAALESGLKTALSGTVDFSADIIKTRTKRKSEQNKLATLVEKQERCFDDLEQSRFWVTEFKKVRLWVINAALHYLEVLVNGNLQALGMLNWGVSFTITKDTKSGKSSPGLYATIYDTQEPDDLREKPWNTVSGGEAQRLRLACMAGLMDLIANRSGVLVDTEFWDEPSNHLSSSGLDSMLAFLDSRAQAGKHVWLIDHTSLAYPFAHMCNVVKDGEGSKVS